MSERENICKFSRDILTNLYLSSVFHFTKEHVKARKRGANTPYSSFYVYCHVIYMYLHEILREGLSRRLIGELIVYEGIRRPSVVRRLSTFSNDISS